MLDKVAEYSQEIEAYNVSNGEELEQFRIKFLGSKNVIKDLFAAFKDVPNDQKKEFGQRLNELKNQAQNKFDLLQTTVGQAQANVAAEQIDLTRPGYPIEVGARHPVSIVRNEIIEIFERIGFTISEAQKLKMIGIISLL